jgi:hypothetical protein
MSAKRHNNTSFCRCHFTYIFLPTKEIKVATATVFDIQIIINPDVIDCTLWI